MPDTFVSLMKDFVDHGSTEDMVILGKMVAEFVSDVEEDNPKRVEQLLHDMSMYLNPFKCKKRAQASVVDMQNEDGTTGAHWDYDTVEKVAEQEGIKNVPLFYYVLNMIYSDFYYSGYSDKDYIRQARQFVNDKDAPADKALRYYRMTHY